ncbi:hypothetical protein ACFO4O_17130 [Glaciecola siphonariae]|uniref:Uncharacterized protein n=1 Tax=Glaciecola siphonariae TaxID=521012 RepID=A0ABV9LZ65_9ALTE
MQWLQWDSALVGLVLLMNAALMVVLSYKSAKNKTDAHAAVVIQSLVLSFIFFPASWIHCWYWGRRLPDRGFIKLD